MSKRQSLTETAHQYVSKHLAAGDIAIDATLGNGHDTLFLANQVTPLGHVFGFDIQQQAIDSTTQRLKSIGQYSTTLINASHAQMLTHIPSNYKGNIQAVLFNLGYLPGGDKTLTTEIESTLKGLNNALALLSTKGVISIIAYPGHPLGRLETQAVINYCQQLELVGYVVQQIHCASQSTAPQLFIIKR